MAWEEDATDFFNEDNSEAATISGVSSPVYGQYSRDYVEIGDIAGYRPVFLCSTDAVSSVAIGATVTVSGVTGTFTVVQKVMTDRIETTLILET